MRLLPSLVISFLLALPAFGLEYETIDWRGEKALKVSGVIEKGEVARFSTALEGIPIRTHGAKVVLLYSDGGSLGAALDISSYLDEVPVHMVVPEGARCASACASVLFVGGKYRTVEPGGFLGQHACTVNGQVYEECGDILGNHAFMNGVSHGSIAAFIIYGSPDQLVWFSRNDVDCYGVSFYPLEDISSFQKSEPCAIRVITGKEPPPQSAWRLDFLGTGFTAFSRPWADYEREWEVKLYCDNSVPGRVHIAVDVAGPAATIQDAVTHAELTSSALNLTFRSVIFEQMDDIFSRATFYLPRMRSESFLQARGEWRLTFHTKEPFVDIVAKGNFAGSENIIKFAFDNCDG